MSTVLRPDEAGREPAPDARARPPPRAGARDVSPRRAAGRLRVSRLRRAPHRDGARRIPARGAAEDDRGADRGEPAAARRARPRLLARARRRGRAARRACARRIPARSSSSSPGRTRPRWSPERTGRGEERRPARPHAPFRAVPRALGRASSSARLVADPDRAGLALPREGAAPAGAADRDPPASAARSSTARAASSRSRSRRLPSTRSPTTCGTPRARRRRARAAARDAGRARSSRSSRARRASSGSRRQIDPDAADRCSALKLAGIHFVPEPQRFYPKGRLAGAVLGFVGTDDAGLAGLEHLYDRTDPRQARRDRRADGRAAQPLRRGGDGQQPARPGGRVARALARLRRAVRRRARARRGDGASTARKSGSIVVMDPVNGEILAMASAPDFDPNEFAKFPAGRPAQPRHRRRLRAGLDVQDRDGRAGASTPGSSRLDEIIDTGDGTIRVANTTIQEADHHRYGALTLAGVFEHSSNIGIIRVGLRLGRAAALRRRGERSESGKPTGVDLPGENSGIFRPLSRWSASRRLDLDGPGGLAQRAAARADHGGRRQRRAPRAAAPGHARSSSPAGACGRAGAAEPRAGPLGRDGAGDLETSSSASSSTEPAEGRDPGIRRRRQDRHRAEGGRRRIPGRAPRSELRRLRSRRQSALRRGRRPRRAAGQVLRGRRRGAALRARRVAGARDPAGRAAGAAGAGDVLAGPARRGRLRLSGGLVPVSRGSARDRPAAPVRDARRRRRDRRRALPASRSARRRSRSSREPACSRDSRAPASSSRRIRRPARPLRPGAVHTLFLADSADPPASGGRPPRGGTAPPPSRLREAHGSRRRPSGCRRRAARRETWRSRASERLPAGPRRATSSWRSGARSPTASRTSPEALARGAVAVVSDRAPRRRGVAVPWIRVDAPRRALALLAAGSTAIPPRSSSSRPSPGPTARRPRRRCSRRSSRAATERPGFSATTVYRTPERAESTAGRTTPEAPLIQELLAELVADGVPRRRDRGVLARARARPRRRAAASTWPSSRT